MAGDGVRVVLTAYCHQPNAYDDRPPSAVKRFPRSGRLAGYVGRALKQDAAK